MKRVEGTKNHTLEMLKRVEGTKNRTLEMLKLPKQSRGAVL